jgi:hypothetical protein
MSHAPQSYTHHTRWDPVFHFFILPVFILAVITAIVVHIFLHPHHLVHGVLFTIFAIAVLLAVFKIRLYALKVQDRVIRLEEQLRLAALVPDEFRSRIPEFTLEQLIALRFASDAELAGLAQRTLDKHLSPNEIKQAIKIWRPDNHRV